MFNFSSQFDLECDLFVGDIEMPVTNAEMTGSPTINGCATATCTCNCVPTAACM